MVLLTEHMLFYASEKYPGEHEYTKYIIEVHSIHQVQAHSILQKRNHPLSFNN
jgi:hypothetical protein